MPFIFRLPSEPEDASDEPDWALAELAVVAAFGLAGPRLLLLSVAAGPGGVISGGCLPGPLAGLDR